MTFFKLTKFDLNKGGGIKKGGYLQWLQRYTNSQQGVKTGKYFRQLKDTSWKTNAVKFFMIWLRISTETVFSKPFLWRMFLKKLSFLVLVTRKIPTWSQKDITYGFKQTPQTWFWTAFGFKESQPKSNCAWYNQILKI